jgi:thioredoxin reductase
MEMERSTRHALLQRLTLAGVRITTDTSLKEISGNTVTVGDVYTDQKRVIENVDTVVLSYGGIENNDLYYALKGQVKEVYCVGDCRAVRKLVWATEDGAMVARMI